MRTRSLVWDRGLLGRRRGRLFARGLLLVAAGVSALLVCPAVRAQEGASLTEAKQKSSTQAKKLPPATKKAAGQEATAKTPGHAKGSAPKLSLSEPKKPAAGKAGTLSATKGDSAKNSKTSPKKDWQSSCGKEKKTKGTGTKVAATSPRKKGTAPKFAVEQIEVAKKPVWYGEMIECEWVLKNEGDVTLSVTARGG